jgi:hypothetical protein
VRDNNELRQDRNPNLLTLVQTILLFPPQERSGGTHAAFLRADRGACLMAAELHHAGFNGRSCINASTGMPHVAIRAKLPMKRREIGY